MENNLLDILVEPDGTEMLVLLVEDDQVDAERVERLVGSQVKLHVARTTSEAQRMARAFYYRCILLDLKLPDRNGIEVIPVLNKYAPVVVLTGTGSESRAVEAMKRGADDYLSKDLLDGDIIQLALASAIKKRRLERTVSEQEARLAKNDHARAASRLATLTHQESLGPLTELSLMIERLRTVDGLPAEASEYVGSGAKAVSRLRKLSGDLRALLETGSGEKRRARGPALYHGLVVDRDASHASTLKRYLEMSGGWNVNHVVSLSEAFDAMCQTRFAVVLCNHEVQGGSALELIAGAQQAGHAIPVAVYSHWRDERINTRAALAGAYAYFDLQVLSPESLQECVESCVEEFITRRELWQLKERRQAEAYLDTGSSLFNKRYLVEAMAASLQPLGPRVQLAGGLLLVELAPENSCAEEDWNSRIQRAGEQVHEVLGDAQLVVRYSAGVLAVFLPDCADADAPAVAARVVGGLDERLSVAVGGALYTEGQYPGVQHVLNEAERVLAVARESTGSRMEFAFVSEDLQASPGGASVVPTLGTMGKAEQ